MDQLVQCPVCTLFLHNGMSLESHLDTHPKDQVIKALCSMSSNRSNFGSRASTPMNSERSYRSRSRTPATDDAGRWSNSLGDERFWRSSRTPKTSVSCSPTPSEYGPDSASYQPSQMNDASSVCSSFTNKTIKSSQHDSSSVCSGFTNKSIKSSQNDVSSVCSGFTNKSIKSSQHDASSVCSVFTNKSIKSSQNDASSVCSGFTNKSVKSSQHDASSTCSNLTNKTIKTSLPYCTNAMSNYENSYIYSHKQKEEKEVKYSKSPEYNPVHELQGGTYSYNTTNSFHTPPKLSNTFIPPSLTTPKIGNEIVNVMTASKKQEFIKILSKPNQVSLLNTNMGSVQYVAPGVMVPAASPYMQQKSVPAQNLIMATSLSTTPITNKPIPTAISMTSNQFNQISSTPFAPSTTVLTQNSQIIYREMVHNINAKPFLPGLPVLSQHENISNVAQSSSVYQNVMVLDQFGNSSCMYASSQPTPLVPKTQPPLYQTVPTSTGDKNVSDANKTLIIEVGPLEPVPQTSSNPSSASARPEPTRSAKRAEKKTEKLVSDSAADVAVTHKGLKIISNIKVEVPVQHHKNLLNTVVDLTGAVDKDYPKDERPESPERILPDLEDNDSKNCEVETNVRSASIESAVVTNNFSVIKNIGNPPSYIESRGMVNHLDSMKLQESESSNSCPVPDLTCNEKPSVSPCSELSDNGDNAVPHTSVSPKLEDTHIPQQQDIKKELITPLAHCKGNPLRLNNLFVKKKKKILQIKNAKPFPVASTSKSHDTIPSLSSAKATPEEFTITKIHQEDTDNHDSFHEVSIEKIIPSHDDDHGDLDADTETQSMDLELEPVASSTYNNKEFSTIDLTQVKDEGNSSHEFSNELPADPSYNVQPISAVQYYNMDDDFDEDSNNKELLDLEASKTKQFVSMMNDNYFGDNIYADYFAPDRGAFNARESNYNKENMSHIWGESSQKESEFVLPNFSHETFKIAESSGKFEGPSECRKERDYKGDLLSDVRSEGEAPLNICADERMPPRGELSGQESNGDMDAPWAGMYPEVAGSATYDLMARETWASDASDADSRDKRDNMDEDPPKSSVVKDKRIQVPRAAADDRPPPPPPLSIKKEEKTDDIMPGMNLSYESKASIATTMLEVYDAMNAAQPKIEGAVIKQEPKRRRRDYTCPTCNEDQHTDVAFHQHLRIHPLECLTCGKCFYRRANLALHIKMHLGIKNYKCSVCEKRFLTRQKLQEHHNCHSGRTPVQCPLCDRTFRRYSNMLQHRDRHHFNKKPKVRDFVCACGEVFHSRAKLRWHRETHDARPKPCPHCADKFLHMSSLTRHVRRMHNAYYMRDDLKKNENVTCPICKQIYLKSNLKTHLRTHSGKRPFTCVICNKSFTTQWNLKLHRWTHMSRSAKPFKCSLCKGAFIRQSEYVSHMNSHKSVRPYTCNYCGCQFIRKYNCQRHVKEHEMAKKYVCKVPDCGKSFHRSYYLSEHMKVHSGARPFSCNICGKTSSNKSNHNKHVKIHHAREPVATEA